MLQELTHSKYSRPEKLSDPYNDFTRDITKSILEKDDDRFEWADYSAIFGPHLPAGTYEEAVYFLPRAFSYLNRHEAEALDLVCPIFGFCAINIERLREDGLEQCVKNEITGSLNSLTSRFRIEHLDKLMCKSQGRTQEYFDYVHNSEAVCEGLCNLVEFDVFADLAIVFTKSLAYHNDDLIKASWFIQLSSARFEVYAPPKISDIQNLLVNVELLNDAFAVVYPEAQEYKLTYWRDTFARLKL